MRFLLTGILLLVACATVGCGPMKAKNDPYDAVRIGMSQARVLQLMGEPTKRMRVPLEGRVDQPQTVFRYLRNNHLMHVSFVNGEVVGKEKF